MERQLTVTPHPLLRLIAWSSEYPAALGSLPSPPWLSALLAAGAETPIPTPDDALRATVRDLLRHGGYKPTGRGKPASEYLLRAAGEGALRSINAAVDLGNVLSLHSGFPLSVVDLARTEPPLNVAIAEPGASYVFNASGQSIDLSGLLCLCDARGPCANAVKDAERTKTSAETRATLTLLWGVRGFEDRLEQTFSFARTLSERLSASCERLPV